MNPSFYFGGRLINSCVFFVHYDKLLFTKEVNFYGSQQKLCPTTTKFQLTFNSLWPSDAIWENKSGTTFAQVVDFCLAALSHYLNHYLTYHHTWQLDSFHNSVLKFTTKKKIEALPRVLCEGNLAKWAVNSLASDAIWRKDFGQHWLR